MVEHMLEGIELRLGVDYLEYRSVRFENEILDIPNFQGNAAVNYTDREGDTVDEDY